jgi:hypothetical protein
MEFGLSGFFVEAPKGGSTHFSFPGFLISLGFETRMSFLLESVKVCQCYFYFFYKFSLALPNASRTSINCTEICHRIGRKKPIISVMRVVRGAEEIFAKPPDFIERRCANTSASQTEPSRNEYALTVMFASRLRTSPHAVIATRNFPKNNAAGIDQSRLR